MTRKQQRLGLVALGMAALAGATATAVERLRSLLRSNLGYRLCPTNEAALAGGEGQTRKCAAERVQSWR
jgi:hypothetical protein